MAKRQFDNSFITDNKCEIKACNTALSTQGSKILSHVTKPSEISPQINQIQPSQLYPPREETERIIYESNIIIWS